MNYDVCIVGAGIVGLATAMKIKESRPDLKVAVLEKESAVASHQTGNNSGVIHSGIYYAPGSLKALNCIKGYHEMIEFCSTHKIPFELCGKIIVATDEKEIPALKKIYDRGVANGLKGLRFITAEEIKELEPFTKGVEGIFVPQTGIVNYREVTEKYAEIFKEKGGELHLNTRVIGVNKSSEQTIIKTEKGEFSTRLMVNCAGLYCDQIAAFTIPDLDIKIIPFRGEYYSLKKEKRSMVKNLIYPVPDPAFPFLGVHFTRRIDGEIEAGPNAVLAFAKEGYKRSQINFKELLSTLSWKGFRKVAAKYWRTGFGEMYRSFSKSAFTKALQKLMPAITEKDLSPGGAGIRAQACDREGGLIDDFCIRETKGEIHVLNAPSPAATSSLAIGGSVSELVFKQLDKL